MQTLTADDFASAALDTRAGGGDYTPPDLTFPKFKSDIYKRYIGGAHLDRIDWVLQQAVLHVLTQGEQGLGHIAVSMPPRHGKSVTISRLFAPWFLGMYPDYRMILASYGASLAQKHSRYARNIISSRVYQQLFNNQIQLDPSSKAADSWDLHGFEGGLDAMGVGGAVTGKGGHIIIIDDPVKGRDEAESEVMREKVWDWYTDDIYTRREPGASVIVVMTRWHQDDLVGRLLKNEPDKWHYERLPALAEEDDPLEREVDAPLWPERFSLKMLLETKQTMGEYSWAAEYQQRPVPAEGGLFKRSWFFPLHEQHPPIVRTARYWDMAMSDKTSADYTVGVKLAQCEDGHYYVLDVARRQIDWGDLTPWMSEVMLADGTDVIQGIEEKGYMSRAIQNLNQDPRLHDHAVFGYPVDTDKVTRALPYAAKCGAGLVHVMNAHWTTEYIDELCSFNKGAHDDQVDASSGAWAMMDTGVADTVTSFDALATGLEGAY